MYCCPVCLQIVTHLCYSDFNEIMGAIHDMDGKSHRQYSDSTNLHVHTTPTVVIRETVPSDPHVSVGMTVVHTSRPFQQFVCLIMIDAHVVLVIVLVFGPTPSVTFPSMHMW